MSPGAMTTLVRKASSLFEKAEHRTPDVTPPPRPRSAPPGPTTSGREQRGFNPQSMPRPQWVYRSDDRPPSEIFRDGFTARPPGPGGRYDYDLARHQKGGNAEAQNPTGFISTTSSHRTTDQWAQGIIRDGQPVMARDADGTHWHLRTNTVYEIRNSGHFVDARAQDDAHRLPRMDGQHEFAAPHRIEPHSIRSATTVQQWEHPRADGVDVWTRPQGPDGRSLPQPQLHENPGYDPSRLPYNPETSPDSGWRQGD